MKTWIKVLLGLAVVIAFAVGAAFYMTAGMTKTADAFFNAVKQQDVADARNFFAEDFKANTDEAALMTFLESNALAGFKEASWSSRSMSGNRGQLDGSITTETGGVVPIRLTFVKENGDWKIYSIRKPEAGLQTDDAPPHAPDIAERVTLVNQSMHNFLISVTAKDMTHFHSSVSSLWKKQTTPEALNDAFRTIIDSPVDWSVLDDMQPALSSDAEVGDNGVMVLRGNYPTQPNQVNFVQKYIQEDGRWKLIGFNIETS